MTDDVKTGSSTAGATDPTGSTGTGTGSTGTGTGAGSPIVAGHHRHPTGESRLLPHDECDKLTSRLRHAVGEFVDGPRSAVEEADEVLEEAAARFADAVKQRRRTLRASWQGPGEPTTGEARGASGDTEQLRLALRDYRELTERLLRL
ncbi:hypothetical protein PV416_27730 [Streptomyces ipomoeae]|nr:hypothetical protein [Streptomyces ipomoeae]MDX2697296.1 hypothetical protein [Streptomyces ipomoeae]MDX2824784.1 hypothetical protein [Streptomyces ipomoeae]MDX2841843.1 hypothetical protein [Streptomyces ipomoeae]MDX2875244.1 hypothetical protein [Streptomyces ipomoeae]MDX2937520.1 hypothetical protein [Streptomyces ipomoeae]